MEVVFLKKFVADLQKISDKKLKVKIKSFIHELESAESLEEITGIIKMKGDSSSYRWRTGEYRLGFYKDGNTVELARFVKRNDIYKVFP